jgi:hypothetical protein
VTFICVYRRMEILAVHPNSLERPNSAPNVCGDLSEEKLPCYSYEHYAGWVWAVRNENFGVEPFFFFCPVSTSNPHTTTTTTNHWRIDQWLRKSCRQKQRHKLVERCIVKVFCCWRTQAGQHKREQLTKGAA